MTFANDAWNEWQLVTWGSPVTREEVASFESRAAEFRVTPWELTIFDAIWYDFGQVNSKEMLADRCFGVSKTEYPSKVKVAIERCFDEGWIQFVTAEFLNEMKAELQSGGYFISRGLIGEFYEDHGKSIEGLISFTRRGASIFQQWIGFYPQLPDLFHWTHGLDCDGRPAIFGTTALACISAVPHGAAEENQVPDHEPVPIGRWCDRWWNRFEHGYKLRYSGRPLVVPVLGKEQSR